jgi:hypothetical protein
MIPIFQAAENDHVVLRDKPPGDGNQPLFFALPAADTNPDGISSKGQSSVIRPLYEYRDSDGRRVYSINPELTEHDLKRNSEPLCRVWRNPASVLALDPAARTIPLARD